MNYPSRSAGRISAFRNVPTATNRVSLLLITIIVFIVPGCASMSESECLTADWHLIGYEDGAAGRNTSSLTNRRKACAEYGMSPDLEVYQQGYDKGVLLYCTERNGYMKGKQGQQYEGVCPNRVEEEFLYGYRNGRELFSMNSKIYQKSRQVKSKQSKLKALKSEISEIEAELIADETTRERRGVLLDELEEHQLERGNLASEIRELELEAAELQGAYQVRLAQYEVY